MKKIGLHLFALCLTAASSQLLAQNTETITITTYADATRGTLRSIPLGPALPFQSSMLIFDQPLLDQNKNPLNKNPLSGNSGSCVNFSADASQCQWTLDISTGVVPDGAPLGTKPMSGMLVVGGIENTPKPVAPGSQVHSIIPIVGTTGDFLGWSGTMNTTPEDICKDFKCQYKQVLFLSRKMKP